MKILVGPHPFATKIVVDDHSLLWRDVSRCQIFVFAAPKQKRDKIRVVECIVGSLVRAVLH